jgi:hypothetical protein
VCVEPRLHRPSPIPLRRPDVFHVLAGEGGCTRAIGYVSPFFVRFRNVLIGWAFDVRRVRRFAGLLCFILAPTRLAVSMSAELAAYHVSHIAAPSWCTEQALRRRWEALNEAVMSGLRAERCVNAAR